MDTARRRSRSHQAMLARAGWDQEVPGNPQVDPFCFRGMFMSGIKWVWWVINREDQGCVNLHEGEKTLPEKREHGSPAARCRACPPRKPPGGTPQEAGQALEVGWTDQCISRRQRRAGNGLLVLASLRRSNYRVIRGLLLKLMSFESLACSQESKNTSPTAGKPGF